MSWSGIKTNYLSMYLKSQKIASYTAEICGNGKMWYSKFIFIYKIDKSMSASPKTCDKKCLA